MAGQRGLNRLLHHTSGLRSEDILRQNRVSRSTAIQGPIEHELNDHFVRCGGHAMANTKLNSGPFIVVKDSPCSLCGRKAPKLGAPIQVWKRGTCNHFLVPLGTRIEMQRFGNVKVWLKRQPVKNQS